MKKTARLIEELRDIIHALRAPGGCPWDRKQTPADVKEYLVEELYELFEAIDCGEKNMLVEETGDLLFMVLFLANLYEEAGTFRLADSLETIRKKMIHRHPHVFADTKVNSAEEVKQNWQKLKIKEGKKPKKSFLDGIPKNLPALSRAYYVTAKAAAVDFDWDSSADVMKKVHEELGELETARRSGTPDQVKEEMGDLLFSMVNLSRHLGIEPEQALRRANEKFLSRFSYMEQSLAARGKTLKETPLAEMDMIWEEAKKEG